MAVYTQVLGQSTCKGCMLIHTAGAADVLVAGYLRQRGDRYAGEPKSHWLRLVCLLSRRLVAILPVEPASL